MNDTVLFIVGSLLASAFFSAVEIAFISANRLHIEIQKKRGSITAAIASKFIHNQAMFIATTLVGNTVSLVVYGMFMAAVLDPPINDFVTGTFTNLSHQSVDILVLTIQTILSTTLVLATAEFLPKSLSLVDPDKFLTFMALPMNLIYILSYPFVWAIVNVSKFIIVKVFRISYSNDRPAFGLTDLGHYIENTAENHDSGKADEPTIFNVNKEIFTNALEFKKVKVRDCMIPRKEIVAIDINDDIEELKKLFIESGHSKIPVYRDSIDEIFAYCHVFSLFKKPQTIKAISTDIVIVPETILANELMIRFISEHKSMALVVDEFGGTSGIVTIEDIMEEIFGDIEDEHDDAMAVVKKIDNNNYVLSARLEVDYLNEEYQWDIPEGDYETLGGYILHVNHDIPSEGDIIENDRFKFVVKTMVDARIDLIQVTLKEKHNE